MLYVKPFHRTKFVSYAMREYHETCYFLFSKDQDGSETSRRRGIPRSTKFGFPPNRNYEFIPPTRSQSLRLQKVYLPRAACFACKATQIVGFYYFIRMLYCCLLGCCGLKCLVEVLLVCMYTRTLVLDLCDISPSKHAKP